MNIGKTLYVKNRDDWRKWLEKNHQSEKEIWLIYCKKHTNKPRIPYNDAVEEALCFGWIDSTVKRVDEDRTAQRFTPRRKGSSLSEPNRQRIKKLIKQNKMTDFGLEVVKDQLNDEFIFPKDIIDVLKQDSVTWKNFQNFPLDYKKIRMAFIEGARKRPEEFKRRLNNFLKMTAKNKKYGLIK